MSVKLRLIIYSVLSGAPTVVRVAEGNKAVKLEYLTKFSGQSAQMAYALVQHAQMIPGNMNRRDVECFPDEY